MSVSLAQSETGKYLDVFFHGLCFYLHCFRESTFFQYEVVSESVSEADFFKTSYKISTSDSDSDMDSRKI